MERRNKSFTALPVLLNSQVWSLNCWVAMHLMCIAGVRSGLLTIIESSYYIRRRHGYDSTMFVLQLTDRWVKQHHEIQTGLSPSAIYATTSAKNMAHQDAHTTLPLQLLENHSCCKGQYFHNCCFPLCNLVVETCAVRPSLQQRSGYEEGRVNELHIYLCSYCMATAMVRSSIS